MTLIRITKEFNFEMAHALWNYDGDCRNIHGHSYKLFVTLAGKPVEDEDNPKFGMVIDFKDLKEIVKKNIVDFLDHSLVVFKKADNESLKAVKHMYEKVHIFNFQPSCENLVIHIVKTLQPVLPDQIKLHAVKLFETATSYAEWYDSDNEK